MQKYEKAMAELGRLLDEKNAAYGNSFAESNRILEILYPNGVQPRQYKDMLLFARVLDKMFRIATNPGYAGEDPYKDAAGYFGLAFVQALEAVSHDHTAEFGKFKAETVEQKPYETPWNKVERKKPDAEYTVAIKADTTQFTKAVEEAKTAIEKVLSGKGIRLYVNPDATCGRMPEGDCEGECQDCNAPTIGEFVDMKLAEEKYLKVDKPQPYSGIINLAVGDKIELDFNVYVDGQPMFQPRTATFRALSSAQLDVSYPGDMCTPATTKFALVEKALEEAQKTVEDQKKLILEQNREIRRLSQEVKDRALHMEQHDRQVERLRDVVRCLRTGAKDKGGITVLEVPLPDEVTEFCASDLGGFAELRSDLERRSKDFVEHRKFLKTLPRK
jgi:hypothetical protein